MTIRVLLADDHAVVRDGLRALLENQDEFEVVGEAADGREAVRETEKLRPDVVVMDLAMPELNGIEATRRIGELCPTTRVIILSMHGSNEHVYRAFRAGARGYLVKESAGRRVAEAVKAVHAGRPYCDGPIPMGAAGYPVSQRQAGVSPLERLSTREREVLQLVVEGTSSAAIARRLCLSPKTVDTYRSRLMKKLGVRDIPSLVKFALQHALTPPG